MPATDIQNRHLILIGGGHSHALLLKQWGMSPMPGVKLTLIDPLHSAAYTGMLPGFIAGHYSLEQLEIDLTGLARYAGAQFIQASAQNINLEEKSVAVSGQPAISYDVLSIDIGIHSRLDSPNATTAIPVKPLTGFASAWQTFVNKLEASDTPPSIVMLGGGVGGAELALAMRHRLNNKDLPGATIYLIEQTGELLSNLNIRQRHPILHALEDAGISIRLSAQVTNIESQQVTLNGGKTIAADMIISAVGAKPHSWLQQTGLSQQNGFISVDQHLRSISDNSVFATGDCAYMTASPREKAGVFAVRQAPVLFNNLRAALGVGQLKAYHPQRDYLKLVSLGGKSAVALKYGLAIKGGWLWQLKDHIDQRFMAQLNNLP